MRDKGELMLVGAAVGTIFAYKMYKSAKDALNLVNPFSDLNVANQAANAIWASATDGQGTIGTDLFDFFDYPQQHKDAMAKIGLNIYNYKRWVQGTTFKIPLGTIKITQANGQIYFYQPKA